MDAHAFRIVGTCLKQILEGARIEKVFSPFLTVTVWRMYTGNSKLTLALRSDKQRPAFFWLQNPLPNPSAPSATVMRLRKYCSGARLGKSLLDYSARALHFPLLHRGETSHWLTFSLRDGPSLSCTAPEVYPPFWPDATAVASLAGRSQSAEAGPWIAYPLLTPQLRETLACLSLPEAMALLVDLEAGGDSLFYYTRPDGSGGQYWAWPLPPALAEHKSLVLADSGSALASWLSSDSLDMQPTRPNDGWPLLLASMVEEGHLLADYCKTNNKAASLPSSRRKKRLAKTLRVLEEEEKKLHASIAGQKDACLIKDNLWQLDANSRLESITLPVAVPDAPSPEEPTRTIALDPSMSLMDNMARMFRRADKGVRGLAHLVARRQSLEAEMVSLEEGPQPDALAGSVFEGRAQKGTGNAALRHKTPKGSPLDPASGGFRQVSRFTSQEGYTIWRGKNAEGNQSLLKLGQPYDYWLHAADGPSAHAIIRRAHPNDAVPEATLELAARLVAEKSWQRDDSRADIMVALLRHVHPIKGAKAGTVRVDTVLASLRVQTEDRENRE